MLRKLISIFRSESPLQAMGDNFAQMLKITEQTTIKAGGIYFGTEATPEARTWVYTQDVQVNKLERKIRKQVIAHLTISGNAADLPYCLLLMSLVKDVERIGDYAKNLSEIVDICTCPLPDDELVAELKEIRIGVEAALAATSEIFEESDVERALELTHRGHELAHRTESLIEKVARSDYSAGLATSVVLGARFYKRLGGHALNVLSSVTMPLHKLDYYDEKQLPPDQRD
ncbi:MAG: PhoU domain-containing protein [Myxococcota bacterium]|nr:PhoU domain-containing protein [Myxococcota bacterium]